MRSERAERRREQEASGNKINSQQYGILMSSLIIQLHFLFSTKFFKGSTGQIRLPRELKAHDKYNIPRYGL
jgi:hypothetical protein